MQDSYWAAIKRLGLYAIETDKCECLCMGDKALHSSKVSELKQLRRHKYTHLIKLFDHGSSTIGIGDMYGILNCGCGLNNTQNERAQPSQGLYVYVL